MTLIIIIALLHAIAGALFLIGVWKAARVIESADVLETVQRNTAKDCVDNLEIAMRFMEGDFSYKDAKVVADAIKRKYEL